MSESQIIPHRITKPIQLLAAWLTGLAIIDASFLTAAANIQTPTWVPAALVIASIVNVPLFLLSLFLLQTKFRPEMQEDSYYSKYLQKKEPGVQATMAAQSTERRLGELAEKIVVQVSGNADQDQPQKQEKIEKLLEDSEIEYLAERFSLNRTLSELLKFPNLWDELVNSYGEHPDFLKDIDDLTASGLIELPSGDPKDTKLTRTGTEVAEKLQRDKKLWHHKHKRFLN